jgi:hypothetical protein
VFPAPFAWLLAVARTVWLRVSGRAAAANPAAESIPDDSHYFCALVPELFSLVYNMASSALTASEALAAGLGSVAVPAGGVSTTVFVVLPDVILLWSPHKTFSVQPGF